MYLFQYFYLNGILSFSKISYITTAKCKGRMSFDTWYYVVLYATLCVSFSSKSKATNVFPKHILKSKARYQSIQARKNLFCHVIVKNYLCNVSGEFLIKVESTWRRKINEQTSQLTLLHYVGTVSSSHRSRLVLSRFFDGIRLF